MYCKKFLEDFTDKVVEKAKPNEVYLVFSIYPTDIFTNDKHIHLAYMFDSLEDAHTFLNKRNKVEFACKISRMSKYSREFSLASSLGKGWLLKHPKKETKYLVCKQKMTKND